jgi:hypothetical protein
VTTARDLCIDAAYACGALGQDQNLSDGDIQTILRRLNRMMDSWNTERGMIYCISEETFSTVAGQADYSSTLLAEGRPIRVDAMRAVQSQVNYPISIIDNQSWNEIVYKDVLSIPVNCWIEYGFPNATFHFYPKPDSVYEIFVMLWHPLTSDFELATVLEMPPGYAEAIVNNLAVAISGYFGRPVTPDMRNDARNSRSRLRRINYVPLQTNTILGWVWDPTQPFIYKGYGG